MAGQKGKRRSRKARRPATSAARPQPPRPSTNGAAAAGGAIGERPPSPFGGLPVSEIAIAIGLVGVVVGYLESKGVAIAVGAIVCGLAVTEVTAREHFSGFRSHSTLLAAIPAVIVETLLVVVLGEPSNRALLLLPVIPVFAVCFWLLRRSFEAARHARVARPPAP